VQCDGPAGRLATSVTFRGFRDSRRGLAARRQSRRAAGAAPLTRQVSPAPASALEVAARHPPTTLRRTWRVRHGMPSPRHATRRRGRRSAYVASRLVPRRLILAERLGKFSQFWLGDVARSVSAAPVVLARRPLAVHSRFGRPRWQPLSARRVAEKRLELLGGTHLAHDLIDPCRRVNVLVRRTID
jgi:hypothetical protein